MEYLVDFTCTEQIKELRGASDLLELQSEIQKILFLPGIVLFHGKVSISGWLSIAEIGKNTDINIHIYRDKI